MPNNTPSTGGRTLKAVFWGLGILGTAVTWGRTAANGSAALLQEALNGTYVLPGTESPLLESFTGLGPLDYLLRTLVVFFWEVVDGSNPKNSATGLYFAGQLFPIIVAIYLDGLRKGNGPSALKPSLWFLTFSAAAIGCSGAAWALLYTASSPTVLPLALDALQSLSLVSSSRAAGLVLPATFVCFAVPVVLMGLPSPAMVSNEFQQWSIVAWNMFPLLMFTMIKTGEPLINAMFPTRRPLDNSSSKQAHLRAVRWLGAVSIAVGFSIHVAVTTLSLSAAFCPAIFAEGYVEAFHPLSIAVPPISVVKGTTVGDGIWDFMVWDQVVGFTLVMLVYLAQLRNVMGFSDQLQSFGWAKMSIMSGLLSFLVGPGAAVMAVSWLRDELLYSLATKSTHAAKRL